MSPAALGVVIGVGSIVVCIIVALSAKRRAPKSDD